MLKKLAEIEKRYLELEKLLTDQKIIGNRNLYQKYIKEHSELSEVVKKYREFEETKKQIEDNKELLNEKDEELRELAKTEIENLDKNLPALEEELKVLLIPTDPFDGKNIYLEIRAGTGGDEAAIFAADLFRMYSKYADQNGWKVEVESSNQTGIGGYKEIISLISGKNVYGKLKFEGGIHRVQRIPKTETQGRVHTSAVTVAVMPEADEIDLKIEDKDLRIDVFRAGGHGGQSVNTTDSAVRITHLPTGITVSMQDEKSQHKNKSKAMKILRSRILEAELQRQQQERSSERKKMVGSGDRSEKIRTYNFPQNRITDHRVNITLYKLDKVMDGDIAEIIVKLQQQAQIEQLSSEEKK